MTPVDLSSGFYIKHGQLLCDSFSHWTNKPLINKTNDSTEWIRFLYNASFVIVSHGTENDPVFNFGNKLALDLFELDWKEFILLPSRMSAEETSQQKRKQLIQRVTTDGYFDNYSGVRVSSNGKRFLIEEATIWNIIDANNTYYGQAAMFQKWTYL